MKILANLRPTTSEEVSRILDFHRAHPSKFILPRPSQEFAEAVKRRWHYLIEADSNLQAVSGIFDYSVDQPFVEVSETQILEPLQGFRLQGFLFRIRIATVVISQGTDIGITTAVDPNNVPSITSTLRQGFVTWATPIEEAYSSCSTCPNLLEAKSNRKRCWCDYYVLPAEAARARVNSLLEESRDEHVILKNKSGDELIIEYTNCRIIADAEYREMLRDFVNGGTW